MKHTSAFRPKSVMLLLAGILTVAACAQSANEPLKEGAIVDLGGRPALLKRLATLPYVESEYTKRFKFDSFENPKLKELRERHRLDERLDQR